MDIHFVVFSKDRACQADQLLRSMAAHVRCEYRVHLIHLSSGDQYDKGYQQLLREHPHVEGVREDESSLDKILRGIIETADAKYFAMLVDDDVFVRHVSLQDPPWQRWEQDARIACMSLRLAPHKTYCQPLGWRMHVPKIRGGVFDFQASKPWRKHILFELLRRIGVPQRKLRNFFGDWKIVFSVDGNVYELTQFRKFCRKLPPFEHATQIEPLLYDFQQEWDGPLWGTLYEQERLLNLVMNNVDSQGARYPHPGHSVEDMNAMYLAGWRLDYQRFEQQTYNACHVEADPEYKPRSAAS